jgi:hypothetical protein
VTARNSIVALKAQNSQLSSQLIASRPLRKRLPGPAASSCSDSFSAAHRSAEVRSAFARAAHAFNAASADLSAVLKHTARRVEGAAGFDAP